MSMTLIETIELGSSQASITFSSIPQTYTDLKILISARATAGSNIAVMDMELNSSATNFSWVNLRGDGVTAISQNATNNRIGFITGTSATANTFGNTSVYISNYTASQDKSISIDNIQENNTTNAYQFIRAMLWSNTAAITSASFLTDGDGDLAAGTIISLYGITAGGSGTVS